MRNETTSKQLRSFGFMVGGIFAAIGVWPFIFRGAGSPMVGSGPGGISNTSRGDLSIGFGVAP